MTLTFSLKRSNTKSTRTHKKFPRQKFKNDYTTARNLKEWAYCKHNWNDDDYTYLNGNIKKFLLTNIGRPIDKVYSKFLSRCSKLGKFNPKEELYNFIQNKDDIDSRFGGFYLTNSILNYKKPIKKNNLEEVSKYTENRQRFNKLNLTPLLKSLVELKIPQCIGKYLLGIGEKTIYIDFYPKFIFEKPKWKNRHITGIIGIGYGINYNVIDTQTGKTKYFYYVNDNWNNSESDICFYYKV